MSTSDWIALAGVAVGVLGIMAGGFFAISRRLDLHERSINELTAAVARWFRRGD